VAIIFARTRHKYASYIDFWKVVELSGYPVIYVDEIDPHSDNTYVITPLNGEWQQGWKNPRAHIILWDLEWRDNKPDIPGVAEVWASDEGYAQRIGAKYVILGPHPGLCIDDPTKVEKKYDVAMIAYMVWRRSIIESKCIQEGLRVAPNYGAEDDRRREMLLQSRLVLHVHQHENIHTISPTRWMTAAAYRLPILSENADSPGEFVNTCMWADYDQLPAMAKLILSGHHACDLNELSARFHKQLCVDNSFRKCVDNAT